MPILQEIRERFQANLARVQNILALYVEGSGKGRGRRRVHESDLLRAAVMLLHGTFEDLLRSLAEWKLPTAKAEALAEIPLAGTKRGARIDLQELAGFRGRTVDEVIADSVKEYLERSSYNHPGDVKMLLEKVGLSPKLVDGYSLDLAAMMMRRHWIAHRADRNPEKGSGQHAAKSLSAQGVTRWINAVERCGQDILSQF